jgi:hypothetical protein
MSPALSTRNTCEVELLPMNRFPPDPVDTPTMAAPLDDVPDTPTPLVEIPATPVPRGDLPLTPESKAPLVLRSCPLIPVLPLEDDVLLNDVVAISPGPCADVDLRPGPLPEFESVTHGEELEQLVNGTASAPVRELAAVPKNNVAAAREAAIVPNRFTLNIIEVPHSREALNETVSGDDRFGPAIASASSRGTH